MGKPARARILADNQARAMATNIRISPRKLNLVAQSIRGLRAEVALNELSFSRKRIALSVKKVLQSAIANAENNHDLDVDDLIVSEASVGKNMVLKRFHARARGRGAAIQKPYSQITIVVEEKREPAKEEASTEGKSKGGKKRRSSNKTGKKSGGRKRAHKSASKAKKETA